MGGKASHLVPPNFERAHPEFVHFHEVGPGFWNCRTSFHVMKVVDIGTHMTVCRVDGGFVALDTVELCPRAKQELDTLTDGGKLLKAVVATHPFHTLQFAPFHALYRNLPGGGPKFYGTPRHLRKLPGVPWAGSIDEDATRQLFAPAIDIRIPDGTDFADPKPGSNHFSGAFVFHRESKAVHIDDCVMFLPNAGLLGVNRLLGFKGDRLYFHMTMAVALQQRGRECDPGAFGSWMGKLLADWDFVHLATAHNGVWYHSAREQCGALLTRTQPTFVELASRIQAKRAASPTQGWSDDKNEEECG